MDGVVAAFVYEGVVREAIARLKYRNERAVLPVLADWAVVALMAGLDGLDGLGGLAGGGVPDVVTWPPTTRARRRQRGFDQAELIARAVARRLRRPAARLLVRTGGTPQTGHGAHERRVGPTFAPARHVAPARRPPSARSVLLVDDVVTTGATLRSGAATLRGQGYETVIALTVARTPLKGVPRLPDTRTVQTTHHAPAPAPAPTTAALPTTVREDLVRRVSGQLAAGTYQPPVEHVVDRLVAALSPTRRRPAR